jgi:DNA-directed RNA polymerase subunit RPC12/RpoP
MSPSPSEPLKLTAPLPGNALAAELTWLAPRPGLCPGDAAVERVDAQHAELRVQRLSGKWEQRRLTLAEADAWLSEARALQASTAAFDARTRSRASARAEEREQLSATIVPRCPYCDQPRAYAGRRDVVTAGRPEEVQREDSSLRRFGSTTWHEYVCRRCGSLELFGGGLDHPLPGSSP